MLNAAKIEKVVLPVRSSLLESGKAAALQKLLREMAQKLIRDCENGEWDKVLKKLSSGKISQSEVNRAGTDGEACGCSQHL